MNNIRKIFTNQTEKEKLIKNRDFLKTRREQQFKLIQHQQVDNRLLELPLKQLIKEKNILFTFAHRAKQFQYLNAMGDVYIQRAINRPDTIPFSVKDHLRVKGMIQTCGYSHNITPSTHNNQIVEILQTYGLTAYLHSNVPQGLWGIQSNNYVYGLSKNPYNSNFVSGGSCGGQCALVRTRSSAFGIGSDSAGSLRMPASYCGVFSFKPSGSRRFSRLGRISVGGDQGNIIKDIDASMGFITQCVDDLQFLFQKTLGKSTGRDWLVTGTWNQEKYQNQLKKKLKIGYMLQTNQVSTAPAIKNAILQTVEKLKKLGHEVVEIKLQGIVQLKNLLFQMSSTPGIHSTIARRLGVQQSIPNNQQYIMLKRLGNWAFKFKSYLQKQTEKKQIYQNLRSRTLMQYFGTIAKKDAIAEKLRKQWDASGIDVFISPVVPFTALLQGKSKYLINLLTFSCYQNLLEMPAGVIPIRLVKEDQQIYNDNSFYGLEMKESIEKSKGLPVGIQVTGKSNSDEELLAVMKIIQNFTQKLPLPKKQ